jgi:hypothetical protein
MNAHQNIRPTDFSEGGRNGRLNLCRIRAPGGDGDEGAEQRLAAVDKLRPIEGFSGNTFTPTRAPLTRPSGSVPPGRNADFSRQ